MGFMRAGFRGFMGFIGFYKSESLSHNSDDQLLPYNFSTCKMCWSKEKQSDQDKSCLHLYLHLCLKLELWTSLMVLL